MALYIHAGVTKCYTFSLDGLGYVHLYVVRYLAWEEGCTSISSNTVVNEEGRVGKEGEERDKGVLSNTLATHGSAVPRYRRA